jgi:quinol monooxygenase YgiN
MITEIAYITIDPVNAAKFEAAVAEASAVLRQAKNCHGMSLERVIEDPSSYNLRVQWDTVDDHMKVFRESAGFARWRELAGPYFVQTPMVEHTDSVGTFF